MNQANRVTVTATGKQILSQLKVEDRYRKQFPGKQTQAVMFRTHPYKQRKRTIGNSIIPK